MIMNLDSLAQCVATHYSGLSKVLVEHVQVNDSAIGHDARGGGMWLVYFQILGVVQTRTGAQQQIKKERRIYCKKEK